MPTTVYAAFQTENDARRAAGALMDHGVSLENIGFVMPESKSIAKRDAFSPDEVSAPIDITTPADVYWEEREMVERRSLSEMRLDAKPAHETIPMASFAGSASTADTGVSTGITTTTVEDAALGALEGAGIGVGLGLLLGLAAVLVPGVGWVAGTGALVAALAAATGAAGGVAGGVYGYLTDLGLQPSGAQALTERLDTGDILVSVGIGELSVLEIENLLVKYGALSVQAL